MLNKRKEGSQVHDILPNCEETAPPKKITLKSFAKQVAISSFSNIAGGAVGHPLDTIRVS